MPLIFGAYEASVVAEDLEFKVRGQDGEVVVIFRISREEFAKRHQLGPNLSGEFHDRWAQVQEACRIAYMFAEPIPFRSGQAVIPVSLTHFLSDYRN